MSTSQEPPISWSQTVKELGFTELHSGGETPCGDIVIVHGLQGHPYKTWAIKKNSTALQLNKGAQRARFSFHKKDSSRSSAAVPATQSSNGLTDCHQDASVYWPSEMLPKDFPDYRIAVYGYDSHVSHFFVGAANQSNIWTLGREFLQELAAWRRSDPTRPLLFICHSLGGLIVKEALIRGRFSGAEEATEDLFQVYEATYAIVFFGTPHRGSAYSNIGLTATKIVSVIGFNVHDVNIRDLKGNSPLLEKLRESFNALLHEGTMQITTFQEGEGLTGSGFLKGKIVDVESSGIDHPLERKFTIRKNHMEMCRFRNADDDGYTKLCNELHRHMERRNRLQSYRQLRCLDSLYIPDMYVRAEQVETAHKDTLQWLHNPGSQGPGLESWLKDGQSVFWVQGKPGSGKSTAMKHIFRHWQTKSLLASDCDVIGLFFTDRGGQEQRSWNCMLKAMLYELLDRNRKLIPLVIPYGLRRTSHAPVHGGADLERASHFEWDIDSLQEALLRCKDQKDVPVQACYFIDALDEHEGDHEQMGNFLNVLGARSDTASSPSIQICVASRPLNQLADLFGQCPGLRMQDWTKGDIAKYVMSRVSTNRRMQAMLDQGPESQASRLLRSITDRANGVFLWVRLVVDELNRGLVAGESIEALKAHLDSLPDDLHAFFERMLKKVDSRYYRETYILLEAVSRARTPLTLAQASMCIIANSPGVTVDNFIAADDFQFDLGAEGWEMERQTMTCTGGLLELQPPTHVTSPGTNSPATWRSSTQYFASTDGWEGGWTVQPLHQTVKEFLRKPNQLDFLLTEIHGHEEEGSAQLNGHLILLKSCQFWLARPAEQYRSIHIVPRTDELVKDVMYHAPRAEESLAACPVDLLKDIDYRFILRSPARECWPSSCAVSERTCVNFDIDDRCDFFAFAVASGMIKYVSARLAESRNPSIFLKRPSGYPIIFFALSCPGHGADAKECPKMLELLLKYGASVKETIKGERWDAPVDPLVLYLNNSYDHSWQAIKEPFLKTVNILLSQKCNPNGRICTGPEKRTVRIEGITASSPLFTFKRSFNTWISVLNYVALLVDCDHESRFTLFQNLVEAGADLGARSSDDLSLLDSLFLGDVYLSLEAWVWLLEHGAKVTLRLAEQLVQAPNHPLSSPPCRKMEFYEWRAIEYAWASNPQWHNRIINPTHWVRAASNAFLHAYVDSISFINENTSDAEEDSR